MKFKKYIFLALPLLFFAFTSVHKYYLSLTDIEYREESKSVQIIINVFMDDIENALNKDYNIDLQLTTQRELKNNDVYFKKYLKKKLNFNVNGLKKEFNYIGKEYDGDLVYFYLELENIDNVKTINISNEILIKHLPKQQNLVKCKVNKKNKSVLLNKDETSKLFKY